MPSNNEDLPFTEEPTEDELDELFDVLFEDDDDNWDDFYQAGVPIWWDL